jgi:formylglycine-generating enzyme required for sulfatase activity
VNLNPERVLVLKVMATLERSTGVTSAGEPTYAPMELRRDFHLLDGREVVVPLIVASEAEQRLLGVREVLLRIVMAPTTGEGSPQYGAILVRSRHESGTILLDGGAAGALGPGRETLLRHVPPGTHTLSVTHAGGRTPSKPVRAIPRRTVVVDLDQAASDATPPPYRLTGLGRNPAGYEEYRRAADGAVVVKIPAGEFLMGNPNTERTPLEHVVYLSEFLMDKLPVTWARFKQFAASTGLPLPPHEPYWGIHEDHPAVFVTWEEAKTYCEWAGGRLPTEAEREKAARGTDKRKFPWGDAEPDQTRGVFRHDWGREATEPVGTHPAGASPYGLLDMGGNVWEYCADWYDDAYYAVSPRRDPKGPPTGTLHVVRGGSWDSRPAVLSASCRNWSSRGYREGDFGFRCAMNSPRATEPVPK